MRIHSRARFISSHLLIEQVFMNIIPAMAPIFCQCILLFLILFLFLCLLKIPKNYDTAKIITEEVMDNLDMFQSRSGKINKFGWWDLERISADAGTQFTSAEFKE